MTFPCQPSAGFYTERVLMLLGPPLTAEVDYRWQIVKDGQFLHEPALRETTKRWMALHLSVD